MQINFQKINPQQNISLSVQQRKNPTFGNIFNDEEDIFTSAEYTIIELADIVIKLIHEKHIEKYIKIFQNKRYKAALNYLRNRKIEDLGKVLTLNDFEEESYIYDTFKQANINNVAQFSNFLRTFHQNPETEKAFKGQNIEAIKIYGCLNNKSNFSSYTNLLLYLFYMEENEENPNYEKLNTYTDILRKSGIKNESEIDEKLSYLKDEFNNFESIEDKLNAIEYLQKTYPTKIKLLDDILKSSPKTENRDKEQVYEELCDIVNYLYLKNNEKNIDDLKGYIDVLFNLKKLKQPAKNQLIPIFGNIDNPENKIKLAKNLKEHNITIDDINTYTKKSLVSDYNVLSVIKSKEDICRKINNNQPQKLFNNFYAELTAIYTKGEKEKDLEAVCTFLNLIEQHKLKSPNAVLAFYNTLCNTRETNFTTKQLCDFIDLFSYSDDKSITDLNILEQNKKNYYKSLPYIENFLKNNASDYFIGKSPLEIYKEFSYCVDFSDNDSIKTLNDLAVFHQNNSEQLKTRQENFNKFKQYFNSKQSTLDFLIQNKISFDNTEEAEEYKNHCLEILNIISTNSVKAEERINKLNKTGFLYKSKNDLKDFINKYKNSGELNLLTEIIADKEIDSLDVLNEFFNQYKNSSGEYNNLIKHMLTMPDNMNFATYTNIINSLNKFIKQYKIPRGIDNDNIFNIDINKYAEKGIKNITDVNDLLSEVLNIKDKTNFINGLKATYTNNQKKANAYSIALEIVKQLGKTDESYQNIARELKLQEARLNLPVNSDDIIYMYSITKSIPNEFVEFINDNNWTNINNDENKIPNLTLHAKLRLIDRTVLNQPGSIQTLYNDTTKEKLKSIIKSIYNQTPISIYGEGSSNRIIINTPYENGRIESVFSNKGELITAIPKN